MPKTRILLTWLGQQDVLAEEKGVEGPVAAILASAEWPFDEVRILANNWLDRLEQYEGWLSKRMAGLKRPLKISFREAALESPIDYSGIYQVAREELDHLAANDVRITLNLTSGTPAMIATWLLLGKGVYGTELVQTSWQSGLSSIELPFDISLEYLHHQDGLLGQIASNAPDVDVHFDHIQTHSATMGETIALAKRIALRDIPVVIQGDSGTGKEVVATAIHQASVRASEPFVPVNCGAIPEGLVDSHLFGHVKGAFTGAVSNRKGVFDQAHGGTLFLDEVGELPLDAQAKLLRVLQEKEVMPVGASRAHKTDVRIIAATHRDLLAMVEAGDFREDLFYRLAVGLLSLPPLRSRQEDIPDLVRRLMEQLNQEARTQPGYKSKKISKNAINFICSQPWPGNIRELWNTLVRASVWSDGDCLERHHIEKAMIKRGPAVSHLGQRRDVSQGVDISKIVDETKVYYIKEALKLTAGQKVKAARLLGISNHQTLSNWINQLGISDTDY
ncbi:sigma-54 interaction domain-containing protein [Marinobacter shengliensis]|uniref:sigma-54 interaction domain-containing protein n=1 Tax=Marinobacter shengliensis TaxID=1389223 RepID=UPI001E55780D|nr:sigma-54 dependent transcriptional regulator [Marinobacter shengliensis]MCD1630463.1 sigma 54-interacting transcriptional regulator [Marinobacter shengliensis]